MKVSCIICNKKRKPLSAIETILAACLDMSYTCPKCWKKHGVKGSMEAFQNKRNFSLN